MKYFFTILFLSTINFYARAQEIYPWSEIQEVKFYNLDAKKIKRSNFNLSDLDSLKSVSFKKKVWEKILPFDSKVPRDVIIEEGFYIITVKFKNGETVPFQLYPNQKALADLRKNHFNYITLSIQVHYLFTKTFNNALICSKDQNCNEVY